MRAKVIATVTVCVVLISTCVLVREIEVALSEATGNQNRSEENDKYLADYRNGLREGGSYLMVNPAARHRLPNQGRAGSAMLEDGVGTHSMHYGLHQRERQLWLQGEAFRLREDNFDFPPPPLQLLSHHEEAAEGNDTVVASAALEDNETEENHFWNLESPHIGEGSREAEKDEELEERWHRLRAGAELWHTTYVPPISPERKRRLVEKWTDTSSNSRSGEFKDGARRILYVITSFDRGKRLGKKFRGVDKLDYVLMMADEMREACEAGFSPQIHLIAAWDARAVSNAIEERLFCRRTGQTVPITYEEHSPRIEELLSVKHRLYMKSRLQDHDLFIQVEDDMILTINHILLYLEESEKLITRSFSENRKQANYSFAPGFMRIEPAPGADGLDGEASKRGGEWFEWEIILSRFRGARISNAGVYFTLDKSRVLRFHGNNQALWMATQGQLRYLDDKCGYLRYDETTSYRFVEWFSGSLEMFSGPCKLTKVFPASHFEDFMVHHRTNNKNGKRGESMPSVPVSMIRLWAAQMSRDSAMMPEFDGQKRRRLRSAL